MQLHMVLWRLEQHTSHMRTTVTDTITSLQDSDRDVILVSEDYDLTRFMTTCHLPDFIIVCSFMTDQ